MTSLDQLIADGVLRVPRRWRESLPTPPAVNGRRDRLEGMLLGLAIGDALGNTTEAMLPGDRRKQHGEIRGYLPNRHADHRAVGLPSDDSQMAFWTLECLLADGCIVAEHLARAFSSRPIFGMGGTVREFLRSYRAGRPWYEAAQHSAGNGALMRVAPVVLPHLDAPSPALWEDTILAAAVTHNDATSIGACVAFVGMLRELIGMDRAPDPPGGSIPTVSSPSRSRVTSASRRATLLSTSAARRGNSSTPKFVEALAEGSSVLAACDRWYSAAFLLETVPSVVYILARHAQDPEEAIVRAVNDTKDNDTIAAIVGAAVGALHGRSKLPARWIDGLSGRSGGDDDGRIFDLIAAACARWASP